MSVYGCNFKVAVILRQFIGILLSIVIFRKFTTRTLIKVYDFNSHQKSMTLTLINDSNELVSLMRVRVVNIRQITIDNKMPKNYLKITATYSQLSRCILIGVFS